MKPKIVCVIFEEDLHLLDQLSLHSEIDLFEIRLDSFSKPLHSIVPIFTSLPKRSIFTLRSLSQGGISEKERSELFNLQIPHNHYIDIEEGDKQSSNHPLQILSLHIFDPIDPECIPSILKNLQKRSAQIYKLALFSPSSVFSLKLLLHTHDNVVCIPMQKNGEFARLLAYQMGSALFFIGAQTPKAHGQITVEMLKNPYNICSIDDQTQFFALLGDPISASISHLSHNRVFEKLALNARYVKITVKQDELTEFLEISRAFPFCGFSITMPLKTSFGPRSVNTIIRSKDQDHFENTDGKATIQILENHQALTKNILILGGGGLAREITRSLLEKNNKPVIAVRDPNTVRNWAEILGVDVRTFSEITPEFDVIIQATPVGMNGEIFPLCSTQIKKGALAFESIVRPKETPFILLAKQQSCTCIYGYELFIEQAVLQFIYWLSEPSIRKKLRVNFAVIDQIDTIRAIIKETAHEIFS